MAKIVNYKETARHNWKFLTWETSNLIIGSHVDFLLKEMDMFAVQLIDLPTGKVVEVSTNSYGEIEYSFDKDSTEDIKDMQAAALAYFTENTLTPMDAIREVMV